MIDRNESLRDQIATIVQAGYSQRKTSVETADEIRSKISLLSIVTRLERENAELREALNLAFSIKQMSDQELGDLIRNCRKIIGSKP
jgi:cell shape-determining protein MreC